MRLGRSISSALSSLGAGLACLLVPCAALNAAGFPQLSSRYPVGDPTAKNPLDLTDGPKALAAGDINGDGVADIVTGNLDGSVSVLLANQADGLNEQAYFRAGGSIRSVAVADVNKDGKQDVLAADITEGVAVLLGDGDGTLRLHGRIALGMARVLAIADANGDGNLDMAVAISPPDCDHRQKGDMRISVLLGKGDGNFGPPIVLTQGPDGCLYDLAFEDLNLDGIPDVMALDYYQRAILIFPGKGDGSFGSVPPLPLDQSINNGPRSFCLAYLDERIIEGVVPPGATRDLVVANRNGSSLDIYLNLGGFRFDRLRTIDGGSTPRSVVAGDLNGDGLVELLVTNRNANTISVLRGLGDARFSAPLEIAAGTSPREIVVADLTGDGVLDAAVVNRISEDVSLFVGRRGLAGFLVPESYYPAGITPVGVVTGDFNRDGFPDAATVNLRSHDVRVRLNLRNGKFGDETIYPVNFQPSSLDLGDLDHDGRLDLAVVCLGTGGSGSENRGSLVTLLGNGDGTFRNRSVAVGNEFVYQPFWLRLGDLSGDGVLDAAVGGRQGDLVLYRGRGDGSFESPIRLLEPAGSPMTLTLGDLNGDASTDIVISHGRVLLNDGRFFEGGGLGGRLITFPVTDGDWVVEASDLDRDGVLDLVVALTFVKPDPIAVHFGVGDGTFLPPTIYETGMGVVSIKTADMDNDGILDIVCGNRCTADVTILRGLGGRRFERSETIRAYSVEGIAAADLNQDGKMDLVGVGLALWTVQSGGRSDLSDPKEANPAGILPVEGVYINEVMALNDGNYRDLMGGTPDWLEIYNHSAESRDISGWFLRQHTRNDQTSDWTFPHETVLAPRDHLVVFCDKGGSGPGLHASFALSSDGEAVSLHVQTGVSMDRVDFPALPKNVSYARFLDGTRYLCYNGNPTMGTPNGRPINLPPGVKLGDPFLTADGRLGVTARTFDDVGIAFASIGLRVEGQPDVLTIPMADDGAHGDGQPGDGVFGAVLPPLPSGTRVMYSIEAVDLEGEVTTIPDNPELVDELFRLTVPPVARGFRIAEVLADSSTGEDWLELVNCSPTALSLDGLALTKDYFHPQEAWALPAGQSVISGGRVLIQCDNSPDRGPLHAGFRLDKDGDHVLLVRADESWAVMDSISFGPLGTDTSFGIPDCASAARVLARPTPGEPNVEEGVPFLRGNPNGDGALDLSDAIHIINYLFLSGGTPACLKSADLDGGGAVDISDPLYLLSYLFLAGPPPADPFPRCGIDPKPDGLGCESAPGCPR